MAFRRIKQPNGSGSGPVKPSALCTGLRPVISKAANDDDFYTYDPQVEYSDIKLLRYVSATGKEDWYQFLISTSDFFDAKGKIKKELAGNFDECVFFAVSNNHVGIARSLFSLGAKVKYYFSDSLYLAIIKNRHELALLLLENGAKIGQKERLAECLKIADDMMVEIIEQHRDSIDLSLVRDPQQCITDLLEKRKKKKR